MAIAFVLLLIDFFGREVVPADETPIPSAPNPLLRSAAIRDFTLVLVAFGTLHSGSPFQKMRWTSEV